MSASFGIKLPEKLEHWELYNSSVFDHDYILKYYITPPDSLIYVAFFGATGGF